MRADVMLVACLLVLFVGASPARAQGARGKRPGRPSREVVGVRFVVGSTADDNGRTENDVRPPQFRGIQVSNLLQAALDVVPVQRDRLQVRFSGSSGMQHYASLGKAITTGHSGTGLLSFRLDRGTSITLLQTVAYAPNFSLEGTYSPAEGIAGPPTPADPDALPAFVFTDVAITRTPTLNTASSLGISRTVGARGMLALGADLRQTEFENDIVPTVETATARGEFTYRLFGGLGVRAGYARRVGLFGASAPARRVSIDDATLGLDFSRGRSIRIGQRAVLSFQSGSSVLSAEGRREYVVTGVSNLNIALPAGIASRIAFDRSVRLVGGFVAPVLVDSATAALSRRLGNRVSVMASGTYSQGSVRPRAYAERSKYNVWSGAAQLGVAVTARAAAYLSYSYYQQYAGAFADIVGSTARTMRRDSLRAGLTLGVPLFRHELQRRRR